MSDNINPPATPNEQASETDSGKQQQSSWPSETILSSIDLINKIVQEKGGAKPVNRKEISIITGKAEATLVMKLSSSVQYGLLESKFGQGYLPDIFYNKYNNPVFESDKQKVLLQMFSNPELYKKLINEYNGKNLPNDIGLANHLKSDFALNPNSAIKAAKIFLENCRDLNIIDTGNRLKFILPESKTNGTPLTGHDQPPPPPPPPPPPGEDLFELPIPLPNKRKAYLRYPLENLTRKDINVITKALEFIASSLDEE